MTRRLIIKRAIPECHCILRNGLGAIDRTPKVLEAQQHRQYPFQFAVEVRLVASQPLKTIRIERLNERLRLDHRAAFNMDFACGMFRQYELGQESEQITRIGLKGWLAIL